MEKNQTGFGNKIVRGVLNARTGPARPVRSPRPKALVSIVNHEDGPRLKEIMDDCSVSLTFVFSGVGTAHSALLDYLGIGQTEKSILVSLIPETDEELLLREIRQRMSLYRAGRGISFTVPLSGASELVANGLNGAAREKTLEERKIMTGENRTYDLVVAAVAANHADIAMEAARAAGAAGGTVIRARSTGNTKAEQFIGITLTQEQELLLVLTRRENQLAIMEALNEKVGVKTEAQGVIFSLPVDRTAGIAAIAEEPEEKKS